ncbi:hypothetical protein [Anaeromyxobacter oryzae]|uniref:Uncharacterized protein n=1 Tax=Anaeromyxobacter oryzae TaxID=2918170 RepID=A0ABM7X387_9BACT|nr:hypothetical protein [Anaeromyxobacter oryzae]BDG06244.1 hypothetical protein AMOR_52400 [Anaeromyxobacter oryzae]
MAHRTVIITLYVVAFAACIGLNVVTRELAAGADPHAGLASGWLPLTRSDLVDGFAGTAIVCWLVAAGSSWRAHRDQRVRRT